MDLCYRTPGLGGIADVDPERTVCLDLETTGVDGSSDEILQVGIVDGTGEALMSTLVRPTAHSAWPAAQRVNGISPADVADAPTVLDLLPEISGLLASARMVVGFNVLFDLGFLRAVGVPCLDVPVVDVMRELAPVVGVWNPERRSYRWPKLAACAAHYGVDFDPHDACEDAKATVEVFRRMLADDAPGGYLALAARHGAL